MSAEEGCLDCGTEDAGRFDPDRSLEICVDCLDDRALEAREPAEPDPDSLHDRDR